ncbi:UNVERIFIED_ORG: hypothetical protein GGE44_003952 [Rhizobium esperanzae]
MGNAGNRENDPRQSDQQGERGDRGRHYESGLRIGIACRDKAFGLAENECHQIRHPIVHQFGLRHHLFLKKPDCLGCLAAIFERCHFLCQRAVFFEFGLYLINELASALGAHALVVVANSRLEPRGSGRDRLLSGSVVFHRVFEQIPGVGKFQIKKVGFDFTRRHQPMHPEGTDLFGICAKRGNGVQRDVGQNNYEHADDG